MESGKKRLCQECLAMEPDKKRLRRESCFHIPDDILYQKILPRLSCKTLHGFKAVSKAYCEMISSDNQFMTLQSLSPSPTSTGFVYLNEKSGLSFFPGQDRIRVPDPSLKFLGRSPKEVKLLCSTNGLLLFYLWGGVNSLCICNPATKKMEVVPKASMYKFRQEMGLAFNPRSSPERYIIVDPLIDSSATDITYSFNVFRSDTGRWSLSKQTVYIPRSRNAPSMPFYAQGLLFWCCIDKLLWFDAEKDCAGTLPLPYDVDSTESPRLEVDAVNDNIFCTCVTTKGGLEVWMLKGMAPWERSYELSMKKLIQESTQSLYLGLPGDEVMTSNSYILRNFVAPLAFDGKNLYVAVNSSKWRCVMDASFSEEDNFYDDETFSEYLGGFKEADYLFSDLQFDGDDDCDTTLEDLLCCDMVTGKVVNTGMSLIRKERNWKAFHYHNSMVALPPISK